MWPCVCHLQLQVIWIWPLKAVNKVAVTNSTLHRVPADAPPPIASCGLIKVPIWALWAKVTHNCILRLLWYWIGCSKRAHIDLKKAQSVCALYEEDCGLSLVMLLKHSQSQSGVSQILPALTSFCSQKPEKMNIIIACFLSKESNCIWQLLKPEA